MANRVAVRRQSEVSIDFWKVLGHEVFSPERSLNQPKATCVCIRSINQSNRSIFVRLLFLFCSRAFISRSYENHSITFASLPCSSCSYLFASLLFKYLFTLHQSVARLCGTKPIRYASDTPLSRLAQRSFGNCAEIISLLCVNRSSVRFSVRIGAKALWYIVNITLI